MTFAGAKWAMAERRPSWVKSGAPSLDLDLVMGRAWLNGRAYRGEAAIKALFSNFSTPAHYALGLDGKLYAIHANSLDCFHMPPGMCRGQLIEEGRTNFVPGSELFENAAWLSNNVSVSENVEAAPDLSLTADRLSDDSTNASHNIRTQANKTVALGTIYTGSYFVKAETTSLVQLAFQNGGGSFGGDSYVNFDLSTGSVVASGGSPVAYGIQSFAGGWYRIWLALTCTNSATNAGLALLALINSPSAFRLEGYVGSGGSILIWGGQFEAGSFPSSYTPTVGSSVTRAASSISRTTGNEVATMNGSLYSECIPTYLTPSGVIMRLDNNANSNFHALRHSTGGGGQRVGTTVASSPTWNEEIGAIQLNQTNRVAYRFRDSDFGAVINNGVFFSQTSGAVPASLSRLRLGDGSSGGNAFNGYLRRVALYTRGLSNPELQALTAA